jgi:hypothetical protein
MTRYYDAWTTEQIDAGRVIPIPLRHDLIVRVLGVPRDITEQEAEKIGAVVKAMVEPTP